MQSLDQRIKKCETEDIVILPYDTRWVEIFENEKNLLFSSLPSDLVIRIEHIHMVEADSTLWDALIFMHYLTEDPDAAAHYQDLKLTLARKHPNDRVAYTNGKTEFVNQIIAKAKNKK